MTKKNTQLLILAVIVIVAVVALLSTRTKQKEEEIKELYSFKPATFIMEGGYKEAVSYSNEIFDEYYCNTIGKLYSEVAEELVLEKKELLSVCFIPGVNTNHLYLYYGIPTIYNDTEKKDFKYQVTAVVEMSSIARRDICNYRCSDIQIVTDNAEEYYKSAIDICMHNPGIVLDGNTRNMLDYYILYNVDEKIAEEIYDYEHRRVVAYLLKLQREGTGDYRWTTSENAIPDSALDNLTNSPSENSTSENAVSDNSISSNDTVNTDSN